MKRNEFDFLDKTHEFCDKEIAALDAIVKELKQGIDTAIDPKYRIDSKLKLILLRKLFKAQRLMETYWMDAKPRKKKKKNKQFAELAWAGVRGGNQQT